MTEFVTAQLRTVLKTYQNSATKSLQGPGQSLSHHHNSNALILSPTGIIKKEINSSESVDLKEIPVVAPPELPQPILTAPDTGRGELYETILEGKPIGCFLLGGEMRLCLPQFLNNVLTDFTLEEINRIFDDLRIFCSQCTPEQLMEFKSAKILPHDVKASGLITRTDAERLCSALLHRSDKSVVDIPKGAISFKVYHRCFGKCEGICTPDIYSYAKPACIMCLECNGMFSPQTFVGHVHRQQENRTCHWGFDSRNWRDYLHVGLDEENREKYAKMLDELRDLEQQEMINAQRSISCPKRKAGMIEDPAILSLPCKREPLDIPSKKTKIIDDPAFLLEYQRYQQQVSALFYAQCAQREQQLSAFRPWAPKPIIHLPYSTVAAAASAAAAVVTLPYLNQEPPILQNPERVIRHSECERFERTFQPNVALAPRKTVLTKEREKDQQQRDRDRERERDNLLTDIKETSIQIKQERSNSPAIIAQSPEELCSESPKNGSSNLHLQHLNHHSHQSQHNQCTTTATLSSTTIHHPISAPVSPEEISGSNEITSSTSPVPNNNVCSRTSTSPTGAQRQQALEPPSLLVTAINHQETADDNMIVSKPNRIQLGSIVGKLSNSLSLERSPTPPSSREQYSSLKCSSKALNSHLQSPPTQSLSSMSSKANVGLVGSATNRIVIKNRGNSMVAVTNSEFELSTDTDDDSLIGEPDSSNMAIPWDIATEALKDTPVAERDKIIQIMKILMHENTQLRHYAVENAKLQQELRNREEQITELQRELQYVQRELALLSSSSSSSSSSQSITSNVKKVTSNGGGVITKAESCSLLQNDVSPAQSSYHHKSENIKIKVPLKKSSRRSPEDTVVVLNQNLQNREDIITEMKTNNMKNNDHNDTSKNNVSSISSKSNQDIKSLPISNSTNTIKTTAQSISATSSLDSREYELEKNNNNNNTC